VSRRFLFNSGHLYHKRWPADFPVVTLNMTSVRSSTHRYFFVIWHEHFQTEFWIGNLNRRGHLEDLSGQWKILLKCILQ
jgi:hypothetical protein